MDRSSEHLRIGYSSVSSEHLRIGYCSVLALALQGPSYGFPRAGL